MKLAIKLVCETESVLLEYQMVSFLDTRKITEIQSATDASFNFFFLIQVNCYWKKKNKDKIVDSHSHQRIMFNELKRVLTKIQFLLFCLLWWLSAIISNINNNTHMVIMFEMSIIRNILTMKFMYVNKRLC